MKYRLGIVTDDHLVMASDSRINAEYDQIDTREIVPYRKDGLEFTEHRPFSPSDQELQLIHSSWEQSLRRAVEQLPEIQFRSFGSAVCA